MTLHNPQTPPSPQNVTAVGDTAESNISDSSEMEPDTKHTELHGVIRPTADNDSIQVKKNEEKHSIQDLDAVLPGLLPENPDLETEDTQGNNQQESVSVYLEVADPTSHGYPEHWHVCAQFSLAISNPNDPTNYYNNNANHRFSAEEVDWGFTRFYDMKTLAKTTNGKGPFIVNNQTIISVFVRIVKDETGVLWHNFINYDSRKETGYVGIKNQGATCYMNSLLQSLYCTNSFRKAVYQIPTETEEPTKSVALALQRCFYNLQYSSAPIDTTELTKSFGWDSLEAFMQHDVQEFNRVLQDNLELKMKNTPADGAISELFVGKMKSYIKCINVDYESSRVEDYYETLEGENKYMAEGHGLQDANKGVIFESFPPVLHLQLKRFEYDFMRDTMVKINDHYMFPKEINLDEFCSNSENDGPYDYVLHGVLVHSGDLHGGHYFALIKPDKDGKWLRFDDDRVTPVTKKEVFQENFGDEASKGGGNPPFLNGVMRSNSMKMLKRFTNAYMLVYIRKSKLDQVLAPVLEDDIPPHLKIRLNEEKAAVEKRRKDREEMHLYVKVAVVTNESFKTRQEFDLAVFDDKNLETSTGVDVFKVLKSEKVVNFKQSLAEHFKLEPEKFRLWSILYRANKTIRVDSPLSPTDEKLAVERLRDTSCVASQNNGFAKLYLEMTDSEYSKLPQIKKDVSIIFLKYFDIHEQEIRGLGQIYVKANDKIAEIIPILIERAGLPKDTSISLFEEVKPTMIEFMSPKQTFQQAEIQNGDIICFQIAVTEKDAKKMVEQGRHATVREFYTVVHNRIVVLFKPKVDKRGQEVKLNLDRRAGYYYVARELGKLVGAEPSRIRFSTANFMTNKPKDVLAYSPTMNIEQMVPSMLSAGEYAQAVSIESIRTPVVFYEVLDFSVADLETKRFIKVNLLGETLRDEIQVTVLVPKTGFVRDLANVVQTKSKIDPEQLRLFEVTDGRIVKEFSLDQPIDNVGDKLSVLYAEKLSQDETDMDMDNDRLIQIVHYHKEATRYHGIPFRFVAKKGENFAETKKRLQKRTGMSDKEWQKVKFAVIKGLGSGSEEVIPIEKDEFELRAAKIGDEDALGLNHVDKSSRSSRFGGFLERGIFIRG
ncbi:hypothetical protein DFQ28_002094 [Apophysomyces sp. BC1034]|nr:hypothetical protein DFQ28_002094 [Apophysomyces sp. BC1034]